MTNTLKKTISNLPPKGTSDWFPDEYKVRKYIFDTWREVCESYGYKEYLTPLVESADVYRAKSGEDIGGKELMIFTDRAGRELAIRPEMTPSVTRMVTRVYESSPKPMRLFSIANYMRNEKPQRGRNREFWQLNYDLFGSDSLPGDVEILQIALDIMLKFNPPAGAFTMFVNDRRLVDAMFGETLEAMDKDTKTSFIRTLDKYAKLSEEEFDSKLISFGITKDEITKLRLILDSKDINDLANTIPEIKDNNGYQNTLEIIDRLKELGYSDWIKFDASVIRGFDYYDKMVFEVFDNNSENSRSLFGGGRYNGLASIFGSNPFPAVGCAPGDETLKLFLESWKLLDKLEVSDEKVFYIPLLAGKFIIDTSGLSTKIRKLGYRVIQGVDVQKLKKALAYADKESISNVIIIGETEAEDNTATLKNMSTGEQNTYSVEKLISILNEG